MKKSHSKYIMYIVIVIILLISSAIYRLKLYNNEKADTLAQESMKNKKIVTVWLRDSSGIETRKYQVDKYNKEHNDIYIDLKVYKDDYFNLLRMALASEKKVDIFQYGYYEMLKNSNLMSIDKLNLDKSLVDKDNLLYFEGNPYGVKVFGNNVKLVWNKEIFKAAGLNPNNPPSTWQELVTDSQIISKKYPNIVPFEFPAATWGNLKALVGEVAASKGPIYTTFWNYKTGKYDFSYAHDILSVLNYMYVNNLTLKDIEKRSSIDMRRDFYGKQTAMIISTYEDKNYFSNIIPLDFPIGVTDIPKLDIKDKGSYYYTENYTTLVVNKNIQDKDAVKIVYEWLLSEDVNRELLLTGNVLPSNFINTDYANSIYPAYNDTSKFKHETFDPTIYTNYKPDQTRDLIINAIKGKESIDKVIDNLNSNYDGYLKFMEKADGLDFSKYKIKD